MVRLYYGRQYSNGTAEVKLNCGKSTKWYKISKVQYVNFFWRLL